MIYFKIESNSEELLWYLYQHTLNKGELSRGEVKVLDSDTATVSVHSLCRVLCSEESALKTAGFRCKLIHFR